MKIKTSDYNIPNLTKLLKKCSEDTDAASIVYFGDNGKADADFAVIVVKGRDEVKAAAQALERLRLYTPGKPIAPGMQMLGIEFPKI